MKKDTMQAPTKIKLVLIKIFLYVKVNVMTSSITKNKQAHFMMIKGLIQQKYMTVLKLYAPNNIISKYIKQNLTELMEK